MDNDLMDLMDLRDLTDLTGAEAVCTVEKDPERSGLEEMEDSRHTRFCEKHYALVASLADVGLPARGEQFRLVTRRTFNAIQFLQYIADRERIDHLAIAIYSISYDAAKILMGLVDSGRIGHVDMLMSNLRKGAHRAKEKAVVDWFFDHSKIDLFFCSSHAKVFSCKTRDGNYYTLEGSGNLGSNSRVEQYVVDNDEGMYRFSCEWMREIKDFISAKEGRTKRG